MTSSPALSYKRPEGFTNGGGANSMTNDEIPNDEGKPKSEIRIAQTMLVIGASDYLRH
jgi:hypothetical protein